MTEATKSRTDDAHPGFSSRWILDGTRAAATPTASTPGHAGTPVDTDGDGIADTLAVRVDAVAPRVSLLRRLGTWLGRSILTVVFVAALVAAAAAATSLLHTRSDLDAARGELSGVRAQLDSVTTERDAAIADNAALAKDAANATAERDAATKEQAGLELENDVLRGMLVDAQPAAAAKD